MKITENVLPSDAELINLQKIIYGPNEPDKHNDIVYLLKNKSTELLNQSTIVYRYIIENYNIENFLISFCQRMIYEDDITIPTINNMISLFLRGIEFETEYQEMASYINSKHANNKRKATDETNSKKCTEPDKKKIKLVDNMVGEL